MAGSNPALIVRVAATIEDLKKNLGEVKAESQATANAVAQMGGAPTAGMQQLAGATSAVVIPADRLRASLRQMDAVLAQLGFNISGETNALTEMAEASGKTVTQLGLVTTAGLAVGAVIGGWKIGRAVADFFELDQAVATTTAKLLGFGDLAAQTAGAKADVLAKATKTAGFEVRDLATAMTINAEAAQRQAAAFNTIENRLRGWHTELARIDLPAFTKDLNSEVFSVQELADKYRVSVPAIQNFIREQKAAAVGAKEAADQMHEANQRQLKDRQDEINAMKPFRAAMEELNSAGRGWQGTLDTIDGTVVEGIKYYLQAGVSLHALAEAYGLTDAQVKAVASSLGAETEATKAATAAAEELARAHAAEIAALDAATEARKKHNAELVKQREAADAAKAAMRALGGSMEYDLSTDEGMLAFQKANPGASIGVGKEYFKTHTLQQAIAAGLVDLYAAFKGLFGTTKLMGLQGGAENFSGGLAVVGERGPELVSLPRGANVYPSGSHAGAGVVNHIVITVNGPMLGTQQQLARLVDDTLMERQRQIGTRF